MWRGQRNLLALHNGLPKTPKLPQTFLDDLPQQDNWKLSQIRQFSTYPTIYNLMSYNQEYNEQPIYELDIQYTEDSDSDTTILQDLYRCYL